MKSNFRQSMNWLHTWAGFAFGWLLYFIFITGTTGYFENEIDRWMKPEKLVVNQNIDTQQLFNTAEKKLTALAETSPDWYISLPATRSPFMGITWLQLANPETNTPRSWQRKNLNPDNGELVNVRESAGGEILYRMHYSLYYVPYLVGYILTSLATMLMLIALVTGVIIHKKIFIEFFTFRPKKGLRSWLDIHNVFSVLPLPFHLMITYSGLMLLMGITMSTVIDTTYGEGKLKHKEFRKAAHTELKVQEPTDLLPENLTLTAVFNDARLRYPTQKVSFIGLVNRGKGDEHYEIWFDDYQGIHLASMLEYHVENNQVSLEISQGKAGSAGQWYDFFEHLHEGLFADIYLRWLYFISGLLGAGMVATGMLLWVGKQKNVEKGKNKNGKTIAPPLSVTIIERINIGVIAGLPVAIASYFWGNRLLPVTMSTRSEWEVHILFISFMLCITFCLFTQARKAWKALLVLAGIAYLLLPVLNMFTSEHSLVKSINNADWHMFGVDLSFVVFGALFIYGAKRINKSQESGEA